LAVEQALQETLRVSMFRILLFPGACCSEPGFLNNSIFFLFLQTESVKT
jgi:hypothetical protein